MDYEALSMLVPRAVQTWTLTQIRKWLHFIHMQKLLPLFEKNCCTGQSLSNTTSKTLSQMGISSNIMQKKLMVWIQKGFVEFNEYLSRLSIDKQNICPNMNQRKISTVKQSKSLALTTSSKIIKPKTAEKCLKITLFQGAKTVYYIATQKGLKIGRSVSDEIQSLEVTVEANHAQILCQNNEFYLMDMGTKSGSFIKIHYKIQMKVGMLIEMGSYLMKVRQIQEQGKISFDLLNVVTNMNEQLVLDFNQKSSYSFGRRAANDFSRDDMHMSGQHAKIYYMKGKVILQDMGSTNGTWLRLSQFSTKSEPFKLEDNAIFKIGNTITYICTYQNSAQVSQSKMQIEQNCHICTNCNLNPRNIVFLPCKHTINCQDCCTQQSQCPLCQHQIQEKVKIFI